jgi:acyl-CoA thioester hydrolase
MRWSQDRLDRAAYVAPGIDLPIFYGDLDTNRHVNNVALGRYFEQGRLNTHHGIGIDRAVRESGGGLVVARVAIDYLAEVHFGAPLHIRARVVSVGRSSMHQEQAAWQNGQCVALAEVVAVHRRDGAVAEWPDAVRELWLTLRVLPPAGSSATDAVSG